MKTYFIGLRNSIYCNLSLLSTSRGPLIEKIRNIIQITELVQFTDKQIFLSSTAQQFKKQSPPPPYLDQRQRIPEPVPEPVVTACVGKKVSELDDFDYSMPKRSVITNVRPGGFQV